MFFPLLFSCEAINYMVRIQEQGHLRTLPIKLPYSFQRSMGALSITTW